MKSTARDWINGVPNLFSVGRMKPQRTFIYALDTHKKSAIWGAFPPIALSRTQFDSYGFIESGTSLQPMELLSE